MRQQARTQGVPVLNPGRPHAAQDQLQQLEPARHPELHRHDDRHQHSVRQQAYVDKAYTVNLDGVTLEDALQQILSVNGFFYKVLNPTTIVIAPDSQAGHLKYDDLVMQVFYLSHADTQEVSQALNTMMRIQAQVAPAIYPNKTSNTIAVRATAPVVAVAERLIRALDKPRAEVVIEVQILEVNRNRAKQFGINLSDYALGLTFSPEVAPPNTSGTIPPTPPPPFNLNTISQGISTSDFYLTVPTALLQIPRDRLAHEAARQAAAARRGRAGADAQPRRSDSGRLDCLRRRRGRRICQHPAVVVHLSRRRRQHHDDAARDLRRARSSSTSPSRAATSVRTSASPGRTSRRSDPAASRRGCGCARASRTCSPASSRTISGRSCPAWSGLMRVPGLRSLFGVDQRRHRARPTSSCC